MAFSESLRRLPKEQPTFGSKAKNGPARFSGRSGGSGRGEAAKRMINAKKG